MVSTRKVIITTLGGGQGYTLEDTDLWGLECAIQHALADGYLAENREWAKGMLDRLGKLRDQVREGIPGEDEPESRRISFIMEELRSSQPTEEVFSVIIDGKASAEIPKGAVVLEAHITIPPSPEEGHEP
ncbi:hypothetical protein LCGC14_2710740 [marine sediment metagenome]|uniref:Uncharacterized protein n=1 Tax=marine sediment metagenome TaxID=412755 RepID=A0A0F8ZCX8_9ZZZZ